MLDAVEDDAAVNGCRPEFVPKVGGRTFLATADYGDDPPRDAACSTRRPLLKAKRTSTPGGDSSTVGILSGAWNQNLSWESRDGRDWSASRTVIEGRG